MQIVLPPDVEAFVQEQLNSGNYQSPVDVVLAAIDLLRQQEEEKSQKLRQAVEVGLEDSRQGRVVDGPAEMARIRENLRKRHEASAV